MRRPSNLCTGYAHLTVQECVMKTVLAAMSLLFLSVSLSAQATGAQSQSTAQAQQQQGTAELNAIVADIQRVALSTNGNLGKLHIEKWKTDSKQKQQMQSVTESLQRNISNAIPGLISDVQADPASIAKSFKLYHNMTVVYEFLSSLAEAAGAFGKNEEYEPLANDVANLDKVRQNLSDYVERTATTLDAQLKRAGTAQQAAAVSQSPPKKIIVEDNALSKKTRKTTKKKPATATPQP